MPGYLVNNLGYYAVDLIKINKIVFRINRFPGASVKPLSLYLSIGILIFVLAVISPGIIRAVTLKSQVLPVSVTAIGSAVEALHAPNAPESEIPLATGNLPVISGYPGLTNFAASLINGQANQVVGVYVPGEFALPVRQQPSGQPDYVAPEQNVITQFGLPTKYGSVGLLAHNYLSGGQFFQLHANQNVVLIYGDGRLEHYTIAMIEAYQALKPTSPFSEFVNLNDPNHTLLSSADLFNEVYTTNHQVVFQTCIEADGEPSWGRMFIIARLAEPLKLAIPAAGPLTSLN